MNKKFRTLMVLILLDALFWSMPVRSARADTRAPEQFRVTVDQIQTLSVCQFPVIRHDQGTLIFQDSFDENGNVVWENAIFSNWRITFRNPANGKSLSSVRAYNERFVQYDDGSFKTMSAGIVAELVVPGQGLIAANVGVITVTFDASGQPISIVVGGEHDGPIAQFICPYLA